MHSDLLREFQDIDIGHTLRIVAPRPLDRRPTDRISIALERGAFGSGEHETTIACLELVESLAQGRAVASTPQVDTGSASSADSTMRDLRGARVLDVGSGTGVLAIAALRLGAAHATCVDPEPSAVACARRNGDLNALSSRIEHVCGLLDDVRSGPFDLVLANLYGHVLADLAPALVARCKPAAAIVLSGMLWEQDWDVRARFARLGCAERAHRMMSEFSAALLMAPRG